MVLDDQGVSVMLTRKNGYPVGSIEETNAQFRSIRRLSSHGKPIDGEWAQYRFLGMSSLFGQYLKKQYHDEAI